jgi:hypothetical protein
MKFGVPTKRVHNTPSLLGSTYADNILILHLDNWSKAKGTTRQIKTSEVMIPLPFPYSMCKLRFPSSSTLRHAHISFSSTSWLLLLDRNIN